MCSTHGGRPLVTARALVVSRAPTRHSQLRAPGMVAVSKVERARGVGRTECRRGERREQNKQKRAASMATGSFRSPRVGSIDLCPTAPPLVILPHPSQTSHRERETEREREESEPERAKESERIGQRERGAPRWIESPVCPEVLTG